MIKSLFKTQNLQKKSILGEGTYGKCYLVNNSLDNQLYVLKQIDVGGMNPQQIQQTIKEARILEALDHPNIIKCIEAYIENNTLNIIMDYADGGDLSKKIKNAKGCYFSENQILNWFTQLCLAIKHVHDRKIIHRDLKSQNIFLTSQNIVKLGDFGIAKSLQMTLEKNKTVVGTPYYMSPQICQNKQYSLKTDIWSLGVIAFEICALKPPFDANSLPALALKISRGQYGTIPSNYSKDLRRIISDLLQVDPSKRPNINEILKYPLLKNRIDALLPQGIRQRQFSHTTLHSQNIFQRQDLKKQISKLANQQPQLTSIISPRNLSSNLSFFPNQTPQAKISKIKEGISNNKQKNPSQKKKKSDNRKRQILQANLTPKNVQKKVKNSPPFNILQKKRSQKQKSNFFKKKKLPEDYQTQLIQIKQFRNSVMEMHQHLSSDRQKLDERKAQKLVNNFIKEQSEEQSSEEYLQDQSEQSSLTQNTLSNKQKNILTITLEKMINQLIGQKDLSRGYCLLEEQNGFILDMNRQKNRQKYGKIAIEHQGLISLLFGFNNFVKTA